MLIIANPPYKFASDIIRVMVETASESIVLAPFNKYKNNRLWEYVKEVQLGNHFH